MTLTKGDLIVLRDKDGKKIMSYVVIAELPLNGEVIIRPYKEEPHGKSTVS